jgi:hypothetical protein
MKPKRALPCRSFLGLEHIPKKLTDFFDQNMLQLIDLERVLIDWMIPSNQNAL